MPDWLGGRLVKAEISFKAGTKKMNSAKTGVPAV
jgi:hypothetical protein